jgi:hypothetical protein
MKKSKLGQILREITDPFAKKIVEESERPSVQWGDSFKKPQKKQS